jgi:hypothetical protein
VRFKIEVVMRKAAMLLHPDGYCAKASAAAASWKGGAPALPHQQHPPHARKPDGAKQLLTCACSKLKEPSKCSVSGAAVIPS